MLELRLGFHIVLLEKRRTTIDTELERYAPMKKTAVALHTLTVGCSQ